MFAGFLFFRPMHFFLDPHFNPNVGELNPEESRHATKVLRMKIGDQIEIGDGKGHLFDATIASLGKQITVSINEIKSFSRGENSIAIAIAPPKNSSRFEWFLEKATELGIDSFYPIITRRSERKQVKTERAEKIVLTAAKQSKRVFLPFIHPIQNFSEALNIDSDHKMIAHCIESMERKKVTPAPGHSIIFIGPEGDFNEEEILEAEKQGYQSIILSQNRLRTETAAILAVAMHQF